MKNLLKISAAFKPRLLATGLGLLLSVIAGVNSQAAQRNDNLDQMTFIEMINSVDLEDQSNFIQQFQDKEARAKLISKFNDIEGCSVETFRNKEVLLITIPTRYIFAPNETLLNERASEFLSPFKRYLRIPDTYRVLIVVHTDNTGSEQYRDIITEERADSIFEWFEEQGCDTSFLFPYAMGDDMPIYENDSQKNRDNNRRVEIYLVPGTKMLEQAKRGRIEF